MSNKDRWLQAEHSLQTFLKNPQTYLEDERLFAAQSRVISSISINWSYYRQYDNFGIYRVALRIDNPLVIDAQGNNWNAIDIKLPGSNRKHWKTRQLAEYAQTHGYDGVQINNVYDLGPNYIPGADRWPGARAVRMGKGSEKDGIGRTCGDLGAKGEMRMGRREMGRLSKI